MCVDYGFASPAVEPELRERSVDESREMLLHKSGLSKAVKVPRIAEEGKSCATSMLKS